MKTLRLTNAEAAATGFTHKAVISAADGDFSAAATSQTYALHTLAVGEIVRNVGRKTATRLSGGSASACTAQVGDGSTANLFTTAQSVWGANSPIDYQSGDGAGFNQAGGTAITTAATLTLTLTSTGANISTITAGEIHIYFSIADLTQL